MLKKLTRQFNESKKTPNPNKKRKTKPQQPAQPPNPDYMGFGAHMFPPIMIGPEPKHSIEELVYNTSNRRMHNKALDMKNGNSQIIVNEDGFIFVETRNKENALKILNLIMAHGAFYGFPLHPVLEHELVLANYDKQNLAMGNMEWSAETRRSYLMDNCFNPTYDSTTLKKSVKLDTIKEILSNTEKLLEHEDLAADLRLLNDGWAHLLNSDFAPSFILGWSVIEMHYHDLWHARYHLVEMLVIRVHPDKTIQVGNQFTIFYEILSVKIKLIKILLAF